MRSEHRLRGVARFRRQLMERTLAEARERATERDALLQQARACREAERLGELDAMPVEESGLTRATLYERLRLLAVARAYAAEMRQEAGSLEQEAAELAALEERLRREAAGYQQRTEKVSRMASHWQQARRRKTARIEERHIEEEFACRLR